MSREQIISVLSGIIKEGSIVTTGVASPLPLLAIRLAQLSKDFTYLNCIGAVDPKIKESTYSSVTKYALENKNSELKLESIWDYANRGLIDLMFFGASQVDSKGNVNITCIGDYSSPRVKLPGPAAAISLRKTVKKGIIVIPKHSKRVFVEKLDFLTSPNVGNTIVVTNLCIFELGNEPKLVSVHPGHTLEEVKENTGFEFAVPKELNETPSPTQSEIESINKLDNNKVLGRL
ncbi:CoA-transferase [Candidatus Woesearchaeota archaeon]|nr:CoA-transferase [Candidatus Woesearchaeota archaeon]